MVNYKSACLKCERIGAFAVDSSRFTWHLLLLKNTWNIIGSCNWALLFVVSTCKAARARAKGRSPMRRWGIKIETKTWKRKDKNNSISFFTCKVSYDNWYFMDLWGWKQDYLQKHQNWDDLCWAVDEVGHLGRDAFVQRVQVRGEPDGRDELGDRDDKKGCGLWQIIFVYCPEFQYSVNLLTIRPTGVVSKKLRGACIVAWTDLLHRTLDPVTKTRELENYFARLLQGHRRTLDADNNQGYKGPGFLLTGWSKAFTGP